MGAVRQNGGLNDQTQGQPARSPVAWRDWAVAGALIAALLLVYSPALRGDRLLDDDVHITSPELRSGQGLARIWSEPGVTQQYYPVLHTAFWIQHRWWGDAVIGYHVVNVLLHGLAALLVVALVRQLNLPGAWLAGFLFALHPVNVESVAWIAEQKNTLSGVFYFAAAVMYLRYLDRRRPAAYAAASGLFLAALLSKTATATLPAALVLVAWWKAPGKGPGLTVTGWRHDALLLTPWFAAAVGIGLITLRIEQALIAGIEADVSLSAVERWMIAGRALWFYAWKVVLPANLTFFYERWPVEAASVAWHLFPLGALAVGGGCLAMARRSRGPLTAFLYFAGTLFPVLGFIDIEWFVFAFVADHFQYLACIGLIVPFAGWVAGRLDATVGRATAAAVVTACAVLTWRHSATFRDSARLYANAAARSPASVVAQHHLGVALARYPERRDEAVAAFRRAVALNPNAAEPRAKLGGLLLVTPGGMSEGITQLETALKLKPGLATARTHLAAAYFDEAIALPPERVADTIRRYQRAIELDAGFANAHYNLANSLLRLEGREVEAIGHYETALRIRPDFAEAHLNLGSVLARKRAGWPAAAEHFRAALRANPNLTQARNNLAELERRGVK